MRKRRAENAEWALTMAQRRRHKGKHVSHLVIHDPIFHQSHVRCQIARRGILKHTVTGLKGGRGRRGGEGGLCGIFAKNPCVYLIETQSVEGSLGDPGQDSQGGGREEVRILAGIGEESEMEWNWFLL